MDIAEIYEKCEDQGTYIARLEALRWHGKPVCPYCKSPNSTPLSNEQRHHCNTCNTSYSVTVNSIFHKSKLPLHKWFMAIALILNDRSSISARQLGRHLRVTKDTAWYVGMRIRKAMFEDRDLLMDIAQQRGT